MDWTAVGGITAVVAVSAATLRYIGQRAVEYTALVSHMTREETQVWPSVKALDEKLTRNHKEVLKLHADHGERLARVEARMPNGQIKTIQASLDAISDKIDALTAR
jgi:hypothetical protein